MKKIIRRLYFEILRYSGFIKLWRFLHRNDLIILKIHGVMDIDVPSYWVPLRAQLSRKRLDLSLKEISKRYRIISLQDAVEMIRGNIPVIPYSLVLTFDDGYRNNIKFALPILRKYAAPATFFIATGYVEYRRPFWFDRLDYALQHLPKDGREVQISPNIIVNSNMDRLKLQMLYEEFRDNSKRIIRNDLEMMEEMEKIAVKIESEGGKRLADIFEEDDWTAVLTWEEIRNALQEDVCFGSHTVDHMRVGLVDGENIKEQFTRSKESIEINTGRECRYLCYPNGSYSNLASDIARECHYHAALTTVEGANRVGDDLMALKRINFPSSECVSELLAALCSLSIFKKLHS